MARSIRPGVGQVSLYAALAAIKARSVGADTKTGETARWFCIGIHPAGNEPAASLSDEELVDGMDPCR